MNCPSTIVGLVVGLAFTACAARLPTPPTCSHEGDTPVRVPYPPPPAQVEMVGPAPDDEAIWVDGSWQWTGQSYAWSAGGWEHPPPDAAYAPPACVRRANGELLYFAASWHGLGLDAGTKDAEP